MCSRQISGGFTEEQVLQYLTLVSSYSSTDILVYDSDGCLHSIVTKKSAFLVTEYFVTKQQFSEVLYEDSYFYELLDMSGNGYVYSFLFGIAIFSISYLFGALLSALRRWR